MKPARGVIVVLAGLALAASVLACGGDTYCQAGPRYGTSCYSGATVRPNDPLAPVAPLPPTTNHGGATTWWKGNDPVADAAAPVMFGHAVDAGSGD